MSRRIAAVAALVLSLTACGHEANGTVTKKHHADGYTTYRSQVVPCGTKTCVIPQQVWVPDEWTLTIAGQDCDVDHEVYEHTNVGQTYTGHCA